MKDHIFDVIAQSFNAETGLPNGPARTERIDTETNRLFRKVTNLRQIHKAYERFWNELNQQPEHFIFVQSITPLSSYPNNETVENILAYREDII